MLASMILGYVLGAKVASARDDNNVLDAAAAAAAGAGDSLLAAREVDSMEVRVRTATVFLYSFLP